jgi:aquaporin Z
MESMRKYLVEFLGTCFLVWAAALSGGVGAGIILAVMVYAGGHVSGGHYNPAVSLAIFLRGGMPLKDMLLYWVAQILGGLKAAFTLMFIFDKTGSASCLIPSLMQGVSAELIGTTALAYVVLHVATAKANAGNSFYGMAIGGTVTAMALAFGGFSGGAFNPAVAIALTVQKTFCMEQLWVYLASCFAGGALAALLFKLTTKE